jgi:aspartyl-tRNA(Asn)/glutamyl-tRNA(Gln) amidotransferase subunit B
LNRDGLAITDSPVSAAVNNAILRMVADKTISGKIAKDVLDIVWTEGGDPAEIVRARGLVQVTDTSAIEAAIDAVIAANPEKVEEVKAKPKLAGWFVGQVMKQTGGKANPQAVNALLKARLGIPEEG